MLQQLLFSDFEPDSTDRDRDRDYLTSHLMNYIGNKRKLAGFINGALIKTCSLLGKEKISFLDLFSGTGVVSRIARPRASLIIANDLEKYSYIFNRCYLSNGSEYPQARLRGIIKELEQLWEVSPREGFISEMYSPQDERNIQKGERVFYTKRNACFLDTVIPEILAIEESLRPYLLAPILSQASVNVNTSGVFKGFHKNRQGIGQYGGEAQDALVRIKRDICCAEPILSDVEIDYEVYNEDANSLVKNCDIEFDIAYFDPPYNQHPYGSNYFMLNLLCDYQRPTNVSSVSGVPSDWKRSAYNKRQEAEESLFEAISEVAAKFVLVSYNSEGFIPPDSFVSYLNELGKLEVMDTRYNTFRGCRNLNQRDIHTREYLFMLDKR